MSNMRHTERCTLAADGLIHIAEHLAKNHVWTWCSLVYLVEGKWTTDKPTCLTCIVLAGEMTTD